jgi:auxin efflux carrier family protein
MVSAVSSVILAAGQAVAKVYFIGAIGWFSTRFPADRPLLPVAVVPIVARFSFHVLVLSLVFSTTAKSVNVDTIGRYWPLIVGAFFVLAVSYGSASLTATILLHGKKCLRDQVDVGALNVAATFPNIVALPILIFPSLCEFEAVSKGYASDRTLEAAELIDRCIAESNTVRALVGFMAFAFSQMRSRHFLQPDDLLLLL